MSETWTDDFGYLLSSVHKADTCRGTFCTIHNPSEHPLSLAPQKWSDIYGVMLRECKHRKFHVDADETSKRVKKAPFCIGCCNCCKHEEESE